VKQTVYIETTIISYLAAWPSNDLIRAAQQRTTLDWWRDQRDRFDVLCSELVVLECSGGDPQAAVERLKAIQNIPLLPLTPAATKVADALLAAKAIPLNASRDAAHVGICAVHGVSFLLTWNFKHLANAKMQDRIRETCIAEGYEPPIICSPDALSEDES
jgi:hypothetical protein